MNKNQLLKLKEGQNVTVINTFTNETPDPVGVRVVAEMVDNAGEVLQVVRVNERGSVRLSDGWWYGHNHVRYTRKTDDRVSTINISVEHMTFGS